uniref:Uncharacterized protein n=1 Tax=Arundo donax TaxID=35708 RepID=A0A0A8Z9G4_ARUDO
MSSCTAPSSRSKHEKTTSMLPEPTATAGMNPATPAPATPAPKFPVSLQIGFLVTCCCT